jgi:hypothetical protein
VTTAALYRRKVEPLRERLPISSTCLSGRTSLVGCFPSDHRASARRRDALVMGITGRELRSEPAARPCCRLSDFRPPQLSNLSPPLTRLLRTSQRGWALRASTLGRERMNCRAVSVLQRLVGTWRDVDVACRVSGLPHMAAAIAGVELPLPRVQQTDRLQESGRWMVTRRALIKRQTMLLTWQIALVRKPRLFPAGSKR